MVNEPTAPVGMTAVAHIIVNGDIKFRIWGMDLGHSTFHDDVTNQLMQMFPGFPQSVLLSLVQNVVAGTTPKTLFAYNQHGVNVTVQLVAQNV